jgi:hypothetical protein
VASLLFLRIDHPSQEVGSLLGHKLEVAEQLRALRGRAELAGDARDEGALPGVERPVRVPAGDQGAREVGFHVEGDRQHTAHRVTVGVRDRRVRRAPTLHVLPASPGLSSGGQTERTQGGRSEIREHERGFAPLQHERRAAQPKTGCEDEDSSAVRSIRGLTDFDVGGGRVFRTIDRGAVPPPRPCREVIQKTGGQQTAPTAIRPRGWRSGATPAVRSLVVEHTGRCRWVQPRDVELDELVSTEVERSPLGEAADLDDGPSTRLAGPTRSRTSPDQPPQIRIDDLAVRFHSLT